MTSLKSRKNIRLQSYDYCKNGSYFITICIQNRENRLGEIVDGKMRLNNAGEMVDRWLINSTRHFENILIKHKIIMPNHIHFILNIKYSNQESANIPTIIQWFKTMTTNEYIRGVKQSIYPPFNRRIWQRNYYEHIIRNEDSFYKIAQYIRNNPKSWENDRLYS